MNGPRVKTEIYDVSGQNFFGHVYSKKEEDVSEQIFPLCVKLNWDKHKRGVCIKTWTTVLKRGSP